MPRKSKTSARKIAAAMNAAEILRLRLEGLSFREIGERAGLSAGHCCRVVGKLLEERAADTSEQIALWRRLEIARTERQIQALWPKATSGNIGASEQVRKLTETQCKLLGLFAPARVALTDPTGEREFGGGLSALLREGDL